VKNVIIYTDGSAKGNPGNGGYGVVLMCGSHRKEVSEGFELTTNNRMELLSVIMMREILFFKKKFL
jgi:ribonuclease HI